MIDNPNTPGSPRAITMQINSFPALQRLLGDDPEMHLALRGSVIDKLTPVLAQKLSAELMSAAGLRKTVETVASALRNEQVSAIEEVVGKVRNGVHPSITLHPPVVAAIRAQARAEVFDKVSEVVRGAVAELDIGKVVATYIKQIVTAELQEKARVAALDAVKAAFATA